MAEIKEIHGKVISYCDIPQAITDGHYLSDYQPDCYVEYSLGYEGEDPVDDWIMGAWPELVGHTFYIHIDY